MWLICLRFNGELDKKLLHEGQNMLWVKHDCCWMKEHLVYFCLMQILFAWGLMVS